MKAVQLSPFVSVQDFRTKFQKWLIRFYVESKLDFSKLLSSSVTRDEHRQESYKASSWGGKGDEAGGMSSIGYLRHARSKAGLPRPLSCMQATAFPC